MRGLQFKTMKKLLSLIAIASLAIGLSGCGTTPTQTAANIETVTVPTVDAAMGTWAKWCYATNATAQQINDVSNAYTAYINSQLIASNVLAYAASNPTGTVNLTNILNAATASQGALISIITLYTTK